MMESQPTPRTLLDNESATEAASTSEYHAPEVIRVGKATDLVQSFTGEKYADAYTGYTWER